MGVLAASFALAQATDPVAIHGALSVKGNRIVDQQDAPVALAGVSLFWTNNGWGGDRFYNAGAVATLRKDWNAAVIRAAMGVEAPGGYMRDPHGNTARVVAVVDAAIAQGMYVVIDWHSHLAHEHQPEAIQFFQSMARRYGHTPNVIYEIFNEPLDDADWSRTIKPYAVALIAAIRAIDPDNLIVVGTPGWSQDVDKAAADPIRDQRNIAYTLHFYAGSHGRELREKAQGALDAGLALFVTEWGSVSSRDGGRVSEKETMRWMEFLREHRLSHCSWALNDGKEGASALRPGTSAEGPWPDSNLTASGKLARDIARGWSTVDDAASNRR